MAGLALIFEQAEPVSEVVFSEFLETIASFKHLETPSEWASGGCCLAAKLDAPCSLFRGIAKDDQTGSWILAAGTMIDLDDSNSDSRLKPLLQDYLKYGESVFSRLDGQFALIVYNAPEHKVLIISDPFGLIPIYYGQKGQRFYVSTSALAVAKAIQSAPSEFGVRSFIVYGSTFGDTLWQDVHMLPPATVLNIDRDSAHQSIYWSFEMDSTITALSMADSADFIVDSFSKNMRKSLNREGRTWISLTGGLDSRTLAALAHHSHIPFKTYSHGPLDSRDVRIAKRISRKMGWEHEYYSLPEDWGTQRVNWFDRVLGQTDGQLDVIKMSRTIREQKLKAQQHCVSLWGYGGELYRGYYWKQEFWNTGVTQTVNYDRLMDYRVSPSKDSILKDAELWKGKLRAEIKHRFQMVGEQEPAWPNTVKLDLIGSALERHACGITIASVMGDQRVILPFDFKENISRIFSVNYKWRTHAQMFRLILERINPELAKMEIADGGPALPMRYSNFYRFIPYWLDTGEKLLWKMAFKSTGKAPWKRRDAGPDGKAYPTGQWLQDTVHHLQDEPVLTIDKMISSEIYDNSALLDLAGNSLMNIASEGLLGRILALELALQSTASSSYTVVN